MHFEIYQDDSNEYRWRLRARNGKILADSAESYTELRGCRAGITSVKRVTRKTPIEVLLTDLAKVVLEYYEEPPREP